MVRLAIMALEPTFTRSEVVLVYDRMDLTPIETAARAMVEGELLPNWELSNLPARLVLLSRSGSSIVVIESRRTTIQTRYFAEFVKPASADLRRRNMSEKLKALYPLLQASTFTPLFLGLVASVRVSAATKQLASELKERIHQAPISQHLRFDSHDWYEFLLRFSTELDDDRFVTTQVSWYEERVMSVFSNDSADMQVRDWEVPVESSGIEIRVDMNNKRGLMKGKRKWTIDRDFNELVELFHSGLPAHVKRALTMVNLQECIWE